MSTGNQNLDLLVKLLGQTTNDNDNIALLAVRAANKQLEKFNTTWEALLRGRVTVVADPFANATPNPAVRSTTPPAAVRPAPEPVYNQRPPQPAYTSSTPPRPTASAKPAPRPQPTQAAQAAPIGPNRFAAKCYQCGRNVMAGEGTLMGQTLKGSWNVSCGPQKGHNAPYAQRRANPKPAASADDLADLLS